MTTPPLTPTTTDGRDGPRVRAAKDRAGRHGEGAYGNPLRSGRPAAGDGTGPKVRAVTSGQGSQSFKPGRKRAL